MSKELDNVIKNWNDQITNTESVEERASKSLFEELKSISRQIDKDPDAFSEFSVEINGHFDACVSYSAVETDKCICNLILNMVYSARNLKEQFRNQLKNEKEEENT